MIEIEPIGEWRTQRLAAQDDNWGGSVAFIERPDAYSPDALAGLGTFSHAEVLFYFHAADSARIVSSAQHLRNNPAWPKVGIFAQRGKNRPNRIGSAVVRVLAVDGRVLRVGELDAIHGTPVLDIKPVLREFQPRTEARQPGCATELMQAYWPPSTD